jgi:hypothetical protein
LSLTDYLPAIVAGVAVVIGYALAANSIKQITKQEIRAQPLEQILKQMGFKSAKFKDLNDLKPEGFQMLRQLMYDFYTYTKPPASTTGIAGQLAQLGELAKSLTPQKTTAQTQTGPGEGGVSG